MNSKITPAEPFPENLTVQDDIEIHVLHSRLQRQLGHGREHELGSDLETANNQPPGQYARIPALDPVVFEELATDLASRALALDYLTSFESLLSGRIQRIERALEDQDGEEIITALMSLQASAAMAGAKQLEASATRVLADEPVERTMPGPLVRKLQGQAVLFSDAFAELRQRRFTSVA
jgi:hypothetical protein